MIKAVFFDIDGTLVSFKTHVVPKSTLHAIELLKKKGIKEFYLIRVIAVRLTIWAILSSMDM